MRKLKIKKNFGIFLTPHPAHQHIHEAARSRTRKTRDFTKIR